jgi:hypothetical protein
MPKNRKETEDFIISHINAILGDNSNEHVYKEMFQNMSDKDFDKYIDDLESGNKYLVVIVPNMGKTKLSVERNLQLAKKLGVQFFQRIWFTQEGTQEKYLSPIPYMVLDLPIRRQSQLLDKKMSIPEDQNSVDIFTNQPAGKSKGGKVAYTELQVLTALGLDNCIIELIKMRGGDEGGYRAMSKSLKEKGSVDLNVLKQYSTGVQSTRTLKTFLTGAHLQNTL